MLGVAQRVPGCSSRPRPCRRGPAVRFSVVTPRAAAEAQKQAAVKRLVLLRHGQAVEERSVVDHQRSLTGPGREEVAKVAAKLLKETGVPDVVLCSDTVRSRETIDAMREACREFSAAKVSYLSILYVAAAMDGETKRKLQEQILLALEDGGIAAGTDPAFIMCVGHNKGWQEAASQLAGTEVVLETASAAVLEAPGPWSSALREGNKWSLRGVLKP